MAPETIADLATARMVIADLQAVLTRAEGENTLLRQKLDVLCHKLFGKKSEGAAVTRNSGWRSRSSPRS